MKTSPGNPDAQTVDILRWNLERLSLRPTEVHPPQDLHRLIQGVEELPALPETGRRLLQLLDDPDADADDLARVVETDPAVAAQLIRWANSAYYAPRRPITSLKDAITRTLGFEQAANLALGLTALTPLQTPATGVIGRNAVTRHAVQASRLMQELLPKIPAPDRPGAGQVQLCGLIQNIGYLLLDYLLPAAFAFLEQVIRNNSRLQLPVVEEFALGADHGQLGLWLLETWAMPLPVQVAVRHHHNPGYSGPHETLVHLNCLADQLLSTQATGLGPAAEETQSLALMERLGLTPEDCAGAWSRALGNH